MSRRIDEKRRMEWLGVTLAGAFVIAAGSQTVLQVIKGGSTLAMAKEKKRFVVGRTEYAERGSIYSADGKLLAQSADTFELSLTYKDVPKSESFFLALADASQIPALELRAPAMDGSKSKTWHTPISSEAAGAIYDVKTHWRADGVSLRKVPRREYPLADVTGSIIGFLDQEKGATGLESSQDPALKGHDGYREGLVDRKGAFLPMRMTSNDRRAMDGDDLTLTLDSNLQVAATAALKRAVETNLADQGVAIVMEPSSGKVIAAASWIPDKLKRQNGFNPLVMARFEPGSTFKILTLANALEKGITGPNQIIHCGGQIQVADRTMRCAHGAHGDLTPRGVISKSCNVAAASWALKLGYPEMVTFLKRSRLTEAPGVGLPGEIGGHFDEKDFNKRVQVANMGFGQSLSTTPMGIASVFNSLANYGIMNHPRLISRIGSTDLSEKPGVRLFSPLTANTLMEFMVSTFEDESGTAHGLRIPGYTLAGKTGTAQKIRGRSDTMKKGYVSNFVGYVPGNRPVATVLVMIDNPKGGKYYGGAVAGPVFREIALALIKRYNLPKD